MSTADEVIAKLRLYATRHPPTKAYPAGATTGGMTGITLGQVETLAREIASLRRLLQLQSEETERWKAAFETRPS